MKRPWQVEELGWLYEQFCAGVSKERLAEQTGRTVRAVTLQLKIAGIREARTARGQAICGVAQVMP